MSRYCNRGGGRRDFGRRFDDGKRERFTAFVFVARRTVGESYTHTDEEKKIGPSYHAEYVVIKRFTALAVPYYQLSPDTQPQRRRRRRRQIVRHGDVPACESATRTAERQRRSNATAPTPPRDRASCSPIRARLVRTRIRPSGGAAMSLKRAVKN